MTLFGFALPAIAQVSDGVVRIGVLTDLAGQSSDFNGEGSVAAVRLAIEDVGGKVLGSPVEVISADHQNKPDIGSAIAREWIDVKGVDMLIDMPNSAVALAVQEITRDKRVAIFVGAASDRLYSDACSPTGFLWNYDSATIARAIGQAFAAGGPKKWFFITADYAFGLGMERQLSAVVEGGGGTVAGVAHHPFGATDYASFVLQAQASGADVVALLNSGEDTINAIKAATDFGLVGSRQQLVTSVFYVLSVQALGLSLAQGIDAVTPWYWDQDDAARAFTKRWQAAMRTTRPPTHTQAGVYSAALAYLKAVEAAGTDDARAVAAKMHDLPVADPTFGRGARIRQDGRLMKDMFLAKVKTPAQSKYPWDYYDLQRTLPAADIIRPLAEGHCGYLTK